jgi:hypothetical protein
MIKIEYLCEGCIVAAVCTKLCTKFTDKAVDILMDPPSDKELPIIYKELKKDMRCLLCRKNTITINILTFVGRTDYKTIQATCNFCDTLFVIKQSPSGDYLNDVYWEFSEQRLQSVFTFQKLFKDLEIEV